MFLTLTNKILSSAAQCYVEKPGRWSDITCIVRQMKHLFFPDILSPVGLLVLVGKLPTHN